jgi:hypothetical protein
MTRLVTAYGAIQYDNMRFSLALVDISLAVKEEWRI